MNLMNSSEISLRAAVFSAKRQMADGENFAEKIRTQALGQLEIAQQAEGLFQGIKQSGSLQAAAINAAVSSLQMAYQAIHSELQEAKFKRQRFVAECETHLATFIINTQKEVTEYSREEKAIRLFYKIAQEKCQDFQEYLGMNMHQTDEKSHEQYFTVLPFYRMSQALEQNGIIASIVDHHRQAIFLFLKTGLPLQEYYEYYKTHSKIWLQMMGLMHSTNYLNHLRAPRFIISVISNLLWNLQHPVNIETGIPLTLSECATICYKASMFLNDILNPNQFPHLSLIDDKGRNLQRTLAKAELLIKSLHMAFEHERLHEINLNDVSKYLHTALRLMSKKLLELIYHQENASEKLVGQIMLMGELFLQNHNLYEYFINTEDDSSRFTPEHTNSTPCTLMDVIAIFTHLTPGKRDRIFQNLIATEQEAEVQLAELLKEFHQAFLAPFEITLIQKLQLSKLTRRQMYHQTASRFIPLITLVIESFTIFKDTRPRKTIDSDAAHQKDASLDSIRDKAQRQAILENASRPDDEHHYKWSLDCFLSSNLQNRQDLDLLLKKQNQIRLRTQEIDRYAAQIKENRAKLLDANYKNLMLDYLEKTVPFLNEIKEEFAVVEKTMILDSRFHRDQKRILQPMFDELEHIISSIIPSISMVKAIMSSKDFEKNEKERMAEKSLSPGMSPSLKGRTKPKYTKQSSLASIKEEDNEDLDSLLGDIQTTNKTKHSFLYYATLSQLGLIGGVFALNFSMHFITCSFMVNLSLVLLGLGIPMILFINNQMRHHIEEFKNDAMESIFK